MTKIEFKSAFLDTAPLIYLIEGHPQFASVVKDILIYCQHQSVHLTTSVLTELEFKTKPMRENRMDVIQAFNEFLVDSRMNMVPITTEITSKALTLQQQLSLKAFDSLQLGAALVHQCDVFITNDKRLIQLNQPQIITLDQWN